MTDSEKLDEILDLVRKLAGKAEATVNAFEPPPEGPITVVGARAWAAKSVGRSVYFELDPDDPTVTWAVFRYPGGAGGPMAPDKTAKRMVER